MTKPQIKSLASGIPGSKRLSSKMLNKLQYKEANHEMWWTCQDCGDTFDAKKLYPINECPKCGSKNIK